MRSTTGVAIPRQKLPAGAIEKPEDSHAGVLTGSEWQCYFSLDGSGIRDIIEIKIHHLLLIVTYFCYKSRIC